MDYFNAGVQAKRNKEFDLALKYYEMEQKKEGLSVALLAAVAKIYYLKKDKNLAYLFNLATVHLAMHLNLYHYKRGDIGTVSYINSIPEDVRSQFPHEVAVMLYADTNYARHMAHVIMDDENIFESAPHLRKYADIYYAHILGDGSYETVLKNYNISPDQQVNIDQEDYIPRGIDILLESVKWNQLENADVYSLYFS